MRCNLLNILSGCNARVALTVYRSGNGWLAYYPGAGAPPDPSATYWGSLVPHMKMIAATIPSLESAAAFTPDQAEVYEAQDKQMEESIGGAAAKTALVAPAKRPEATQWPALPEGSPEEAPTPSRLRVDVGWSLWQQDGEGTDLQYQVQFLLDNCLYQLMPCQITSRQNTMVFRTLVARRQNTRCTMNKSAAKRQHRQQLYGYLCAAGVHNCNRRDCGVW